MSKSKELAPAADAYDGRHDLDPVSVTLPVGVWRTLVFALFQQFGEDEMQAKMRAMFGIKDDEQAVDHNNRLKRRVGYAIEVITGEASKADPETFAEGVAHVGQHFAAGTLEYLRAQEKLGNTSREAIEAELTVEAIAAQTAAVAALNERMREGATAEAWTEAGAEAEAELRKAAGLKHN